jgi:hypothetical protein
VLAVSIIKTRIVKMRAFIVVAPYTKGLPAQHEQQRRVVAGCNPTIRERDLALEQDVGAV